MNMKMCLSDSHLHSLKIMDIYNYTEVKQTQCV